MTNNYLMALDAADGGGRCLLADVERGTVAQAFRPWVHRARPGTGGLGWDLELETIWSRLGEAANEALQRAGATPDQIAGVAATSMRRSTVVLDADGQAVLATPSHDGRGAREASQLATSHGDELHVRTGHWPTPLTSAARLRWLASSAPAAWKRAATVLSLSDWVTYRLCGEKATDPSQAAETLLLDVANRDWGAELMERVAIPRRILPPLRHSGSRIGSLTREAAERLGLHAGTPVAIAGTDTQCGLIGAGAVSAGQVAVLAGRTAHVQLVLDRPCIDPQQRVRTGCHVVPGLWVIESSARDMGTALEWLAHLLYPDAPRPVARFLAEASLSQPGSAGMLTTFGAAVMSARDLPSPTGTLTLSHLNAPDDPQRRRHLVRSVVDGMAYAVRANLEQLRNLADADDEALLLAGGMSRGIFFGQVVSDVVGMPVTPGATGEAAALGAALCAGVGAGVFRDLAEAAETLSLTRHTLQPDADRSRTYHELYGGWQELRAAREEADALAAELLRPSAPRAPDDTSAAPVAAPHPRILVTADMDDEALAALRELGDVEYASFRQAMRLLTGSSLVDALRNTNVFVTEVDIIDAKAIDKLSELRVIATCRGDAVNVDIAACTAFGIPVLHAPGRNAVAVADVTVAFMLMLARKLPEASAFLRQPGIEAGDTGRMGQAFGTLQGRELWRKTVGLVGLGAVGRAVAQRLTGFGARVLVHDPYVPPEHVVMAGAEPATFHELLERSDFVSLHTAATDETTGLIGAAELSRMKPGAFLVNSARAALVDEGALVEALRSGHLGGAAIDVFPVEPPGCDHPLLALDNVIATPHIGGNTVDVASHQGRIIADELGRLTRGERPHHALNPEVLSDFDWSKPRPQPDAATIERLSAQPGPAVTDIQRRPAATAETKPTAGAAETPAAPAAAIDAPPEIVERMQRILQGFTDRINRDDAVRAAAADKTVTLHFTATDLALSFYIRLHNGELDCGLGEPDGGADVELKMRADVLDGMFTDRVNPMQATMSGGLSFSGDTAKAMTLQDLQADLSRLYQAAREDVGDPGDLAALPDATAAAQGAPAARPVTPGDVREELIQVVAELYGQELITATGGNVSYRIPGTDELWITPSQLFKGDLRPEILVRLDIAGRTLGSGNLSPSSERLMHCAVYRARSDARAVVHAHAPHATILANTGLPFLPVSTEAAFFGNIPRVPFIMPGSDELASAVEEAIRDSWAVLLANHGLLVAGRTLRRAADMVEIIDRAAEVILGCYAVGKEPTTLPDDLIDTLQKMGDLLA